MTDLKTLKAYAKGKKLPALIHLGNTSTEWLTYILEISKSMPDSLDHSINNRSDVPGEHDYDVLNGNYTQRNLSGKIELDETFARFEDITNIRFGVLKAGKEIPEHLDSPFLYRLLCVINGSHEFTINNKTTVMSSGEIYFVNGCYKHSVKNTNDYSRHAMLAKLPITEINTNELLRTRA